MAEKWMEYDISLADMILIERLAVALLPRHNWNYIDAFRDAVLQGNLFLAATKESEGGLLISPPPAPHQIIIRKASGKWVLRERTSR